MDYKSENKSKNNRRGDNKKKRKKGKELSEIMETVKNRCRPLASHYS